MPEPDTLDLIDLGAFGPDYSLREERVADALAWLAAVGLELAELPGGERFSAILWLLADEQRRMNLRRQLSPQTIARAEAAIAALIHEDWRRQRSAA
jgi:hypothetical protein